jgi:hypothetical protein
MYTDVLRWTNILNAKKKARGLPSRPLPANKIDYFSLVDPLVRPLMYSRRLDSR